MVRVTRNLTRKSMALLTSLLLVLFWVPGLIAATPASAATQGGFEIDGNVTPVSALDWTSSAVTSSPDFAVAHDNPNDTTSFGANSKEADAPSSWGNSGSPPGKADVADVFTYAHNVGTTAYFDFAWTRLSPSGTDGYYIELNKNPNASHMVNGVLTTYPDRSPGDVRFLINEQGNSALGLNGVWSWSGSAWTPVAGPYTGFDIGVSTGTVTPPDSPTYGADEFVEVSLDLTSLVGVSPGCPGQFGYVNFRSYTGGSDKNLEDYVAGFPAPAANTCSALTILKKNGNGSAFLGGATFRITPDPTPGVDQSLPGSHLDVTDNDSNDSNSADGTIVINPAQARASGYTIEERTAPTGYLKATPVSQSGVVAPPGAGADPVTFLDPLGTASFTKTDGTSALGGATFHIEPFSGDALTKYSAIDVTDNTTANDHADANDTNGAVGTIGLANLYTGVYHITEKTPPSGYTASGATLELAINDDHPGGLWTGGISNFTDTKKTTSLPVHKYHLESDGTTKTDISGAVFKLYETASSVTLANFVPGSATLVGSCTTGANGLCSVGDASHIVTWDHNYFWVEQSVPFPYIVPAANTFGPVHITATNVDQTHSATEVDDPRAGISTTATADATLPLTAPDGISDTAHLTDIASSASGVIVFKAYGPNPAACTTNPAYTSTVNATTGSGSYTSGTFTPTTAGQYKWVATYYPNGTADNNNKIAGACTDDGETSVVHPASPTLTTDATSTNTVNGTFHDVATLHNFATPSQTLTVTFTLYTTNNCDPASQVFTSTNNVDGTGHATSGDYTADNTTGTYYWKATLNLNGDVNNTTTNIGDNCGSTVSPNNEVSHAPVLDSPHKYNSPGVVPPPGSPTDPTVSIYANNNVINYTITVHNSGAATMNGVNVTDTLDSVAGPPVRWLSDYSGGCSDSCTYDATLHQLKWTFNLNAGDTKTLTFSVTVDPNDLRSDVIHNQAIVTEGNVTLPTEERQNPVSYPNLSINKCSSPVPHAIISGSNADCTPDVTALVSPGQAIVYALTVTNSGDAAATGVTVTDAVPPHTTFSTASCDSPCTASESAGTVTWSNVTVPANGSTTVHFTVNVAANATDTTKIDNVGSFTWSNSGGQTADQSGTSATIEHVVGVPLITGSKSANPPGAGDSADGIVHPGDTITYTIQAKNDGLAQKVITITDAVPTGTTYTSGAKCDDLSFTCTFDGVTAGVLHWTLTLPGNSHTTVSFPVTVNAGDFDTEPIDNIANVDNQDTNNVHHEVTTPIISAVKSSDPAYAAGATPTLVGPNTVINYTITVTNSGHQDKTGLVVTDNVPSGTTYRNDAACTVLAGCAVDVTGLPTLKWTLDVAAGTSRTVTFSVLTPDVQSALVNNTATFTNDHTPNCVGTTCDTNTTHHEVVFPVINAHKTSNPASGSAGNPATVVPGQDITYMIAVDNSGQADASNVHVSDVVPTGLVFKSASSGGSYDSTTNTVSWTLDTVTAGAEATVLSFVATVPADAANGTLYDNTATFDNRHTPNCVPAGEGSCSTETTHHEVRFPVLTLAKSSDPASGSIVQRGDQIDYTITLTNTGFDAANKTITDTLPDHVTVVGTPSPAFTTHNGSTVTWDVTVPPATNGEGGLVPGSVSVTYSVTVDKDAPEGSTLTNVALIDGQCVGNEDDSACTTDHHVPTGALTLVKRVDKATAQYGDTLTYTFTAGTTGALDQTNVVVHDVLPKGTAYVAGSAKCTDVGTCTASFNSSTKTVTWALGDMAHGTSRHLVFKVTIVTPSFDPQVGLPPETIVNSGTISSTETPTTPSNQVVTKVVTVLGVKVVRPPKLPFTGVPAQTMLFAALSMLGAGIILTSVRRRREQ